MQPQGADPDDLRLAFVIPAPGGAIAFAARLKFAVAAIPVAVRFTAAEKVIGEAVMNDQGMIWGRQFVVRYKLLFVSDSGRGLDLLFVLVKEDIIKGEAQGEFAKKNIAAQGSWVFATEELSDSNGDYTKPFENQDKAREEYRKLIKTGNLGKAVQIQNFRYYNSIVEKEPAKMEDAHVVIESGFKVVIEADAKNATLNVERTPFANRGAKAGIVDKAAAGKFELKV